MSPLASMALRKYIAGASTPFIGYRPKLERLTNERKRAKPFGILVASRKEEHDADEDSLSMHRKTSFADVVLLGRLFVLHK